MHNVVSRDLANIWHPCSQMKDYEAQKPLVVNQAQGAYWMLDDGRKILDGISSWWCKSLGHGHPRLKAALVAQADCFEHVILANTTNDVIVTLSEQLTQLSSGLNKVLYASDGACAVEIALKMSVHARLLTGQVKKTGFISLKNAYHGETLGALSVSDLKLYSTPYQSMMFKEHHIIEVPYVSGDQDPVFHHAELHWQSVLPQLEQLAETTTAIVVEPLVQGAGGMQVYSADFLKRLREWTQLNDIHLIVDEIMTGFGRTGKMLASEHAGIEGDFVCLGKGLTAGWLPLSAVMLTDEIYHLFYTDYEPTKSFLHSHTHSGNALAASVALETLQVLRDEQVLTNVERLSPLMRKAMDQIVSETGLLKNVRSFGMMVAADINIDAPDRRLGFEFFQQALSKGVFLRPLGNTIYWMPPLNVDQTVINQLAEVTQSALMDML